MHESISINARLSSNVEGHSAPAEEPHDISGLFMIACLFTVAGGYLGAFSYIAHGHVFANAQTGNFVFFAVFASAGQWAQAWRHVPPPIVAFSLGVALAKLLGVQTQKHTFRATLLYQEFEVAILAVLAVVGARLPNASVVPLISFVAALQNTSLDRIGQWSFNSPMTTGNLRDAVSGLVLWITGRETVENRRKAITIETPQRYRRGSLTKRLNFTLARA